MAHKIPQDVYDLYMTLLAVYLCKKEHLSLLTDQSSYDSKRTILSQGFDDHLCSLSKYNFQAYIESGIAANLTMEGIQISADTPIEQIVRFRTKYKDELAYYRQGMEKMLGEVSDAFSIEALREEIETIYKNNYVPAYKDLEKALTSSRIKWFVDGLSKALLISSGSTYFLNSVGVDNPQAVFIAAGLSFVATAISGHFSYNEKRKEFSYLSLVRRQLGV